MKNQWKMISGFFLVFVIVIFSVLNTKDVPVSFGFTSLEWPLILIILCSAIIGALIVLLVSSTTILKKSKQVKTLQKRVDQSYEETNKVVAEKLEYQQCEYEEKLAFQKESYEEKLKEQQDELTKLREEVKQPQFQKNTSLEE